MDAGMTIMIFNILSYCIAFYLLASLFFNVGTAVRILYFMLIFTVMFIMNVCYPSLSILDLYVCCAFTYPVINKKLKNILISICIAVSVLVYFQVAVMSAGSIIFLVFSRNGVINTYFYNFFMQFWIISCSMLLRKYRKFFFSVYKSKNLLVFELIFKVWFMLLVNLLLPFIFGEIETAYYIVCQLFAAITAVFFWFVKYVVKIETDIYKHTAEFEKLELKSKAIYAKHEEIIKLKHYYNKLYKSLLLFIKKDDMKGLQVFFEQYITPVHENMEKEQANYGQLDRIEIIMIKALIMELINSISVLYNLDIQLIIHVESPVRNVILDDINIFTILNIFVENAIEEVTGVKHGYIYILLEESSHQFTFRMENSIEGYKSIDKPAHSHKGLLIVKKILKKNSGIRIETMIELNKFIQIMEVAYD